MQQKNNDCVDIFSKFIKQIQELKPENILETADKVYAVRQFKINQLTTSMASDIYQNIYLKFNRNLSPKFQLNWWENQLRIFVWVMILYVQLKKTKIQDLNAEDWEFFSLIFPNKKEILFQYQSINILKEHGQAKKWVPQQDQIFSNLVNEKGSKCKWSELAKLLYIISDRKFFRTPKQCRQRWLNHLDPSKSKSQWTTKEDYILIRYVHQKEKRWAEISKLLQNKRNQHSIKNRFKSLITKELKHHKEKLQEAELISCIFKRYTNHINSFSSFRSDDNLDLSSQNKSINQRDSKFEGLRVQQRKNISAQNQQNTFISKSSNKKLSERLMFPFAWYPNKDQKSFKPFSRSQEFLPQQPGDKKIKSSNSNFPSTSMEQLINLNSLTNQNSEQGFFHRFRSDVNLSNRSYEEDESNNENFDKNYYASILAQNFNYRGEDMGLNRNYSDFLPDMCDEYQDSPSLEQQIFPEQIDKKNDMIEQNSSSQMDEQQRRIRAEILLADDPFELLKPFFLKKISSKENTQNM